MTDGDGYSITVDWSNLERRAGEMKGVPDRATELLAYILEGQLKEKTPVGMTGQAQAGWSSAQKSPGVWAVTNPYMWAKYVDTGTRPHAPPMDAIREWAEFRGLPWFPVWLGIVRRGTRAQPYIQACIDATNAQVPVAFNQALSEAKIS